MTSVSGSGSASMRFSLHEVLSGMLGSIEADSFNDNPAGLASMFEDLAKRFPLFAPFAAGVDVQAVKSALDKLVSAKILEQADGKYLISAAGRIQCVGSKRTLFSSSDGQQLEAAATVFNSL